MKTYDLDPYVFFSWNKPRILIDIRTRNKFAKGSLENAISIPYDESGIDLKVIQNVQKRLGNLPVHLIDSDGKIVKQLSKYLPIQYIKGGYQAFKTWRENEFAFGPVLMVIGGYTGSGKTELVYELNKHGHQVIDLEKMACHRGSVFGDVFEQSQPLHEDFHSTLLLKWISLDSNSPLWIEEKGPVIGRVGLPKKLYERMTVSKVIHLKVPFAHRVQFNLKKYGIIPPDAFRERLQALKARMGSGKNQRALDYFNSGRSQKCFELLTNYYDEAYLKRRGKIWTRRMISLPHNPVNPFPTIKKIQSLERAIYRNESINVI